MHRGEGGRSSSTAQALAALLALAGVIDLVSALTPEIRPRLILLEAMVGTSTIRASETAVVLTGILALMLAQSLARRNRRAAGLAMFALLASAVFHMLKGIDFEEASFCLFVAWLLWRARNEFVVQGLPISWHAAAMRTLWFAGLCTVYAESGALLLGRQVRVLMTLGSTSHPAPYPVAAFVGLWTDSPTVEYAGPRGPWFHHSLYVLACVGVIYAAVRLLRPLIHTAPSTEEEREHARVLLGLFGTDTLCYFHMRTDRSFIFAPDGQGFVSYVVRGDVALLGGDPVAAPGSMRQLLEYALDVFASNGLKVCVVGASPEAMALYRSLGLRAVKIGEEARLDLHSFDASRLAKRVRRASRAIKAHGIEIRYFTMASLNASLAKQCQEVSQAWLRAHGGVEQGFSMTSGRLPTAGDREHQMALAVLPGQASEADVVLGFLTLAPVPAANSLSLDHMRRRPDAPNGLMEALIIHCAEHFRDEGFAWLSLNFATLCDKECPEGEGAAIRAARAALFEGARYLPLRSLYDFNKKFNPTWSCRYWLFDNRRSMVSSAVATVRAEISTPSLLPGPLHGFRRTR